MTTISIKRSIPGYRQTESPDAVAAARLTQLRPYVRQSGSDQRGRWRLLPRKLLDYLLVFIGSGHGLFTVGDASFEVNENDLVWIPPDTPHEMNGTSESMNCIYLHVDLLYDSARSHWDACIPGNTLDLRNFSRFMHPPVSDPLFGRLSGRLELKNPARIRAVMEDICRLHKRSQGKAAFALSAKLLELLAELAGQLESGEEDGSLHNDKLQLAAEDIARHDGPFSVKKLAKRYAFSESHFRKLFRKLHGISPQAMRRQVVIQKACELLIYSSKSISEISEELNFNSIYSFSRAFKSAVQISPRHYRSG